jgi:hypothetical protein
MRVSFEANTGKERKEKEEKYKCYEIKQQIAMI